MSDLLDEKLRRAIRIDLIDVSADLLTGNWTSHHKEDLPPRTIRKVIKGLKKDNEHRIALSRILKNCADKL